jgi:biotin transport system substrate-specific component
MQNLQTRDIARTALFVAVIAVCAQISVPVIPPVPFTLQTMAVVLAGLLLGPRLGTLCAITYLVLGLFMPVYAHWSSGPAILFGPLGGYLLGFVPCAFLAGTVAALLRPRGYWGFACASLVAVLPVFALGIPWLAWQMEWTIPKAAWVGGAVYVPSELGKVLIAAGVAAAMARAPLDLPGVAQEG